MVEQMNNYNLQLNQAIAQIKETNAKLVCLQLPDGLKPQAKAIEAEITRQTNARILIWLGSCYGSCDLPLGLEQLGVDLLISWGHRKWEG